MGLVKKLQRGSEPWRGGIWSPCAGKIWSHIHHLTHWLQQHTGGTEHVWWCHCFFVASLFLQIADAGSGEIRRCTCSARRSAVLRSVIRASRHIHGVYRKSTRMNANVTLQWYWLYIVLQDTPRRRLQTFLSGYMFLILQWLCPKYMVAYCNICTINK